MSVIVIADDFSGAAEIAAAAANLGHSSEVQTRFDPTSDVRVIAVDTDTRDLPESDAADIVRQITSAITARATWLYKKTDSVLRGNVRAEIQAIMEAAGIPKSLLIPANPSKSRVIRKGIYFVDGVPLAQTPFAADPRHPRRSSNVLDLLAATGEIPVMHPTDEHDRLFKGIIVPDVEDSQTIKRHASELDDDTLPAGGVDFFSAVMESRLGAGISSQFMEHPNSLLFVCGSRIAWEHGRSMECQQHNIRTFVMPGEFQLTNARLDQLTQQWSRLIADAVGETGRAMVAIGIGPQGAKDGISPTILAERLAEVVVSILQKRPIKAICIEGGATAAALVRAAGWTRLTSLAAPNLAGVSVLCPVGSRSPLLLVKPGSYAWPEQLWNTMEGK